MERWRERKYKDREVERDGDSARKKEKRRVKEE